MTTCPKIVVDLTKNATFSITEMTLDSRVRAGDTMNGYLTRNLTYSAQCCIKSGSDDYLASMTATPEITGEMPVKINVVTRWDTDRLRLGLAYVVQGHGYDMSVQTPLKPLTMLRMIISTVMKFPNPSPELMTKVYNRLVEKYS